jgi:hypothetical protein
MKEAGEFPKSIGLGTKFKEDLVYQLNRKYSKALLDKWTETQREAERGIRRAGDIQTVTGMTSNIELPDTLDTMEQVRQRTAQYFDSVNLNNMDSIKNFSNQLAALSAQYGIPYDVNTGDGAQNVVARQMLTEFPFDPAKHASTYWNGLQQATNPGLRADLERKIEAAKEEWAFTVQKASRSIGGPRADALWSAIQQPNSFAKGGVVYANQGMLVPYQPKGTDTVPAMLTPGEFVVNRQATQKNLPLLKSINRSRGGQVSYLQEGGSVYDEEMKRRREAYQKEMARRREAYAQRGQSQPQQQQQQQQQQQPGAIPQISRQQQQATAQASQAAFDPRNSGDVNKQLAVFGQLLTGTNQVMVQFGTIMQEMVRVSSGAAGNGQPGGVNTSGIEQFTQTFQTFVQQLSEINLPPVIKIEGNVTANVNFAGAEALRSLADTTIRELVESEINRRFNQQNRDNEGQI